MLVSLKKKMGISIQFWMMQTKTKKFYKKYEEVWESIKKEIKIINGDEKIEYGKDF